MGLTIGLQKNKGLEISVDHLLQPKHSSKARFTPSMPSPPRSRTAPEKLCRRIPCDALKDVPAFLASSTRPQRIATAFRTYLRAPHFDAFVAKGPLERRAEEARFLHLGVQVSDRLLLAMHNRCPALLAGIPLEWVVPSALGAFDGKLVFRLLMATTAPRTACSTVRHSCPIP